MSMYRYYLLGPSRRVEFAGKFECQSLEAAQHNARDVLRTDPRLSGVELWQDQRRIHVEVNETRYHSGTNAHLSGRRVTRALH
jgi:hypothetical protein